MTLLPAQRNEWILLDSEIRANTKRMWYCVPLFLISINGFFFGIVAQFLGLVILMILFAGISVLLVFYRHQILYHPRLKLLRKSSSGFYNHDQIDCEVPENTIVFTKYSFSRANVGSNYSWNGARSYSHFEVFLSDVFSGKIILKEFTEANDAKRFMRKCANKMGIQYQSKIIFPNAKE